MKFGFRTPSLSRSIKARTTGRIKRVAKKAVNPLYGKKGMGWVNNPKKAAYNTIYKKTTVGVNDIMKATSGSHTNHVTQQNNHNSTSSHYQGRPSVTTNRQPKNKRVKCNNCKRTFLLNPYEPVCPRCGTQYKGTPPLKIVIIVVAVFFALGVIGMIGQATGLSKPQEKATPSPKPSAVAAAAIPTEKPTEAPTAEPTIEPTIEPTAEPTDEETSEYVEDSTYEESSEDSSETYVWIPTNGGSKYHRTSSCSNMDNPIQVTIEEAEAQGFTSCGRCY